MANWIVTEYREQTLPRALAHTASKIDAEMYASFTMYDRLRTTRTKFADEVRKALAEGRVLNAQQLYHEHFGVLIAINEVEHVEYTGRERNLIEVLLRDGASVR